MSLQWIPLDALVPHPENSNRMHPRLLKKLKGHIQRTGLYEPLVVRPLKGDSQCHVAAEFSREPTASAPLRVAAKLGQSPYQILNGHHARAEVLRELGHTHARCDVWEVDDREARILLATLNRLEGRDDPSARAALVAGLSEGRSPEDLSRLLPEPADAIARLLKLAAPPPATLDPATVPPLPVPMTFFLTEEQHALVSEALTNCGFRISDFGLNGNTKNDTATTAEPLVPNPKPRSAKHATQGEAASEIPNPKCLSRAERLERLALWYLESKNLR